MIYQAIERYEDTPINVFDLHIHLCALTRISCINEGIYSVNEHIDENNAYSFEVEAELKNGVLSTYIGYC